MKIGRLFPDLLATLGRAASPEVGFARTLKRLVTLSGATAGGLCFAPARGAPIVVTAGARRGSPLDLWLRERLAEPARGIRLGTPRTPPPGRPSARPTLLRASLGDGKRPLGRFVLLGRGGRQGLGPDTLPGGFPREFGLAMEQMWRLHQRNLRLKVINIQNARLFEESQRRARETRALLEAGRVVSQSLDVDETIRVILQQAREVLGCRCCGILTLDEATGELTSVASLDLDPESLGRIRLRMGEGVTGLAVKERRPVQSEHLDADPRVRFAQLPAQSGLRSMLATPLVVGDRAIGALTLLRGDVHRFTPEEEALASAFADQAAMALERARLFSSVRTYSERLEAMVAQRTRQLDEQKRFVEVVLETLPLGLYVLDRDLRVVSANREGATALGQAPAPHSAFVDLVPPGAAPAVRAFLAGALDAARVRQSEQEMTVGAEARTLRLSAAPLRAPDGHATHAILLIEDITLQKRMERQMLLAERLSTAGRLVAGVAHELNNPLATIAGCAEALLERARAPELLALPGFKDFPDYLAVIEEEAYRCKEFTGSLLQFVRDPGSRRVPTELNGLVEKALELLGHQARFAGSRMTAELHPALPAVVANEGQLRQVFLGLAANALEAMEGRGTLTVRTRRRPPDEVEVEFTDEGPGIAEHVLPRVFDPFFTTKPPGQGTGLGLAIAQGIVADHGGRIEVASRAGAGASFRVILPVAAGGPPA
jgi:two-component system NtrC family sensor kinase